MRCCQYAASTALAFGIGRVGRGCIHQSRWLGSTAYRSCALIRNNSNEGGGSDAHDVIRSTRYWKRSRLQAGVGSTPPPPPPPAWDLEAPPTSVEKAVELATSWLAQYDVIDPERSAEEMLACATGFASASAMFADLRCRPLGQTAALQPGEQRISSTEVEVVTEDVTESAANAVSPPPQVMTLEQWERFKEMCKRRALHEPVQYIVGEWDFHMLTLEMEAPVLIPRPETEELVELVLGRLRHLQRSRSNNNLSSSVASLESSPSLPPSSSTTTTTTPIHLLDVGSGTGAIGLALLKALPSVRCDAIDPNRVAVGLSLRNAEKVGVHSRYHCLQMTMREYGEWWSKQQQQQQRAVDIGTQRPNDELRKVLQSAEAADGGSGPDRSLTMKYDIIVSNPPYIPLADMSTLDADVVNYEDYGALCGGKDGLDIVRDILKAAPLLLRPEGLREVWMEVDTSHPLLFSATNEDGESASISSSPASVSSSSAAAAAAPTVTAAATAAAALPPGVTRFEWYRDLCGKPRFVCFTF